MDDAALTRRSDEPVALVVPPSVPEVVGDIRLSRAPDVVLAEAHRAARALKDVLDAKAKKVIFNNEQYLEFEDWQTLGRFYGVTCKVTETTYVAYGDVTGFTATAVALRADGIEISAAESACLSDEPNWRGRPLFQIKSMAQTRACAKVLRNVLAWVVVLAGYKPTPAEELADRLPPGKRSRTSTPEKFITRSQQKQLFAAATEHHWPLDQLRIRLREMFHVDSTRELRSSDFEAVLALVDAGPAATVTAPTESEIAF